ncbi:MAG: hypothetical protein H6Q04_1395 [Acidobacteria bacterium]|nr:hypothetical protein [Acidobacteriota bacterium]
MHVSSNALAGFSRQDSLRGPAGILDSMSRSPGKPNAVDMPVSAAAAEGWREKRASTACGQKSFLCAAPRKDFVMAVSLRPY